MRQTPFLFILVLFAACNANDDTKIKSATENEAAASKTQEPAYPYTPTYTSKFEVGDANHSKTILGLAKAWDDNSFDQAKLLFADTITLLAADGSVMSGPADSILNATASYRNSLGTVNTTVHGWLPLKATEKNENWVLVWSTEYRKGANGKTDSTDFQETWRLNSAGKADLLMQYERKLKPAKK